MTAIRLLAGNAVVFSWAKFDLVTSQKRFKSLFLTRDLLLSIIVAAWMQARVSISGEFHCQEFYLMICAGSVDPCKSAVEYSSLMQTWRPEAIIHKRRCNELFIAALIIFCGVPHKSFFQYITITLWEWWIKRFWKGCQFAHSVTSLAILSFGKAHTLRWLAVSLAIYLVS